MKKILILANDSSGLYKFRNELLLQLQQEQLEVVICLPDKACLPELQEEGFRIEHVEMNRRGMNPKQDLDLIKQYRSLLKKEKPDLVLTYTIKPNIYGGYLCGKLHIPYITTVTGLGSAFEKEGLLKKAVVVMYRTGLKKSECIFFQNAENREIFRRLKITGKDDRLVAGSGVNLEAHPFEPYLSDANKRTTCFTYIGRLMQEKGTDEYFEAAQRLHEKYGDKVRFQAIGYYEDDYAEKMKKLEHLSYLEMLPFQKDIHPFMTNSDCIVLPSWHEGMSNVLMEAAATGRATIASDISGCRELVDDGESGFLFPVKDAKALEACMEKFLALPEEKRAEMGRNAREKMEREFDRHSIIDGYVKKIHEILNRT